MIGPESNRGGTTADQAARDKQQLLTALEAALVRVAELRDGAIRGSGTEREALAFVLERAAWSALQLADLWLVQSRTGFPKGGHGSLDALARAGLLDLGLSRRLRYAVESRLLSQRAPGPEDWERIFLALDETCAALGEWKTHVEACFA